MRIGNIVELEEVKIVISELRKDGVLFACGESALYKELKPIPITKEKLLSFGFKVDSNIPNRLYLNGIRYNIDSDIFSFGNRGLNKVRNVHQLQNIFIDIRDFTLI